MSVPSCKLEIIFHEVYWKICGGTRCFCLRVSVKWVQFSMPVNHLVELVTGRRFQVNHGFQPYRARCFPRLWASLFLPRGNAVRLQFVLLLVICFFRFFQQRLYFFHIATLKIHSRIFFDKNTEQFRWRAVVYGRACGGQRIRILWAILCLGRSTNGHEILSRFEKLPISLM